MSGDLQPERNREPDHATHLEEEHHEEREHGVMPVLVEAPEEDAEELEGEKRWWVDV